MSALGQKQTFPVQKVMSALPPKADMCGALAHVRYVPIADIGPSTHLRFWPSLIQELPAGSAGAFLEALMPSADKINFVKMIVCRYGAPQNRP